MQPQKQMATDPQKLWAIDPTHTTVEFAVRSLFFFTVKGCLNALEGNAVLDQADVRNSSTTVVLKSTSIDTGNKRRDALLRAANFLDVARYPEIRFQSTKVERGTDRDTLRVTGALTIKDRSKEIVLDVNEIDKSCSPSGEHIAYYGARTNLDRLDFHVNAMRLLIGRKVQITINVQATRHS
jgi:polyisoprenoid-binding protein YceI